MTEERMELTDKRAVEGRRRRRDEANKRSAGVPECRTGKATVRKLE